MKTYIYKNHVLNLLAYFFSKLVHISKMKTCCDLLALALPINNKCHYLLSHDCMTSLI